QLLVGCGVAATWPRQPAGRGPRWDVEGQLECGRSAGMWKDPNVEGQLRCGRRGAHLRAVGGLWECLRAVGGLWGLICGRWGVCGGSSAGRWGLWGLISAGGGGLWETHLRGRWGSMGLISAGGGVCGGSSAAGGGGLRGLVCEGRWGVYGDECVQYNPKKESTAVFAEVIGISASWVETYAQLVDTNFDDVFAADPYYQTTGAPRLESVAVYSDLRHTIEQIDIK
ncbi:hypothetical protein CYMTET_36491, partial [Cymbomonas tetramitiformis]